MFLTTTAVERQSEGVVAQTRRPAVGVTLVLAVGVQGSKQPLNDPRLALVLLTRTSDGLFTKQFGATRTTRRNVPTVNSSAYLHHKFRVPLTSATLLSSFISTAHVGLSRSRGRWLTAFPPTSRPTLKPWLLGQSAAGGQWPTNY